MASFWIPRETSRVSGFVLLLLLLAGNGDARAWGRGGIGIRSGLKIRRLRSCGFESHRPYQFTWFESWFSCWDVPVELEPMRWNCVRKTRRRRVFNDSPEASAMLRGARSRSEGASPTAPTSSLGSEAAGMNILFCAYFDGKCEEKRKNQPLAWQREIRS